MALSGSGGQAARDPPGGALPEQDPERDAEAHEDAFGKAPMSHTPPHARYGELPHSNQPGETKRKQFTNNIGMDTYVT
jgi:hypothetical protein